MVLYHHTQYIGTTTGKRTVTVQYIYSTYSSWCIHSWFLSTRNHLPPEENVQYKLIFRITIESQLMKFHAIKSSPFTHTTWYVDASVHLELRNVRMSETALGWYSSITLINPLQPQWISGGPSSSHAVAIIIQAPPPQHLTLSFMTEVPKRLMGGLHHYLSSLELERTNGGLVV